MRSAITIAITGSACSGKTTLAYLLEHLLPEAVVIQQDDFRKEAEPVQSSGELSVFDIAAFDRVIEACQDTGELPKGPRGSHNPTDIEAARQHAVRLIPEGERQALKERLTAAVGPHRAVILDGPLLYQDPRLLARANIRLFLRNTKALAKERSVSRPNGDGGSNDNTQRSEAYFEDVVWSNYVKNSSFLFENNNVEDVPRQAITELMGVIVQPRIESSVAETLRWAVDAICTVSEEEP